MQFTQKFTHSISTQNAPNIHSYRTQWTYQTSQTHRTHYTCYVLMVRMSKRIICCTTYKLMFSCVWQEIWIFNVKLWVGLGFCRKLIFSSHLLLMALIMIFNWYKNTDYHQLGQLETDSAVTWLNSKAITPFNLQQEQKTPEYWSSGTNFTKEVANWN